MQHRFAAVLFAASLFSIAAAEDCKDCTEGKVCLTHEATDDIAIRQAQVMLKTKDMIGKREGINAMADAQAKHMNVRSKKISSTLMQALADPDVDVKTLAADKLAEIGVPDLAAQGLAGEVARYRKLIGTSKPKKANELPAWEGNLKMLERMYQSLGSVNSPAVAKTFETDILDSSPFVARAAANATEPLKGQKGIVKALYEGMKKWIGPSQQPARPEGTVEAFFAMSQAMAKVVENPPDKLDGKTQPDVLAKWDAWWKTNGAKYQ